MLTGTILRLLYDLLSLKNYVNVAPKSNEQKNVEQKIIFGCHFEGHWRKYQDPEPGPNPDPDPLVRGMDPRIRIHAKISWIRNTALKRQLGKN